MRSYGERMQPLQFTDPALIVALALAAGVIAQSIAHHLRIPGIVLLLGTGAVLGPDVLGVIQPGALDEALHALVGYAVAVILFEGGLNLNIKRLRKQSTTIRRLVTWGALVTAVGGALAARLIMQWDWRISILFGTLVIVTGPTVVTPLVRRIKLKRKLQTILEAEGVLIDPIGAVIAVVALEVMITPNIPIVASGMVAIALKLLIGAIIGGLGGFFIAWLLRSERLIPDGIENVFALSMVLVLFHFSNMIQPESGIVTVTIAGLVVGNIRTRVLRDLMEFKEGLTVMLIGMLFVLLAADVRFSELRALGVSGLWTVAALMFIVRPLNALVGTAGSDLSIREKSFIAWLAPRGIVAAAVASFFADTLAHDGIPGGGELRALVFLVIAVTVLLQGITGSVLASALGVRRKINTGYAILGANELGLAIGTALRDGGETVLFIDTNIDATKAAEEAGFRVVFGNVLEEGTRERAGLDSVAACIGVTPNEEVNLIFARRVAEEYKIPRLYVLEGSHVTESIIQNAGALALFGGAEKDAGLWTVRLRRATATVEAWTRTAAKGDAWPENPTVPSAIATWMLPLVFTRSKNAFPVDNHAKFPESTRLTIAIFKEHYDDVAEWLRTQGWLPVPPE